MSNKSIKFLWVAIAILFSGLTVGVIAQISNQEKRINLSLSQQEVEVVLQGLGKLPLEQSGNVYSSIIQQAQEQLRAQSPLQKPQFLNKDTLIKKKQ